MEIDRNLVQMFKKVYKEYDNWNYEKIVTNGSAEEKVALAEFGEYLFELAKDECEEVRVAVLTSLNQVMKKQNVLLFKTIDKSGEFIYFVIPSKQRRIVEEMVQDKSDRVSTLAKSVLNWQRARDHYKRFGEQEDISENCYLERAYKNLKDGKLQPVPTCTELGFLERFV